MRRRQDFIQQDTIIMNIWNPQTNALLAQLAEHRSYEPKVTGSTPVGSNNGFLQQKKAPETRNGASVQFKKPLN